MAQEEIPQEILLKRLKRIEGQVRGIEKMVIADRDCESLITQLAALRSAIDSAGTLVLNNHMKLCFRQGDKSDPANINSLERLIAIWGRVRIGDKS